MFEGVGGTPGGLGCQQPQQHQQQPQPRVVTPSSASRRGASAAARDSDSVAFRCTINKNHNHNHNHNVDPKSTANSTLTTPSGHNNTQISTTIATNTATTSAAAAAETAAVTVIQDTGCLDCDFDGKDGPTEIWMAIEDQDWNKVIFRCQHSPTEVRTYVFRKRRRRGNSSISNNNNNNNDDGSRNGGFEKRRSSSENSNIQWRMLPIHAAVISDAPANVLSFLLKAYRDGARAVDDYGMLPIHLAIKKHADPQRINLLLLAFPDCVDVQNNLGQRPVDMAETSSSPHKEYYLRATRRYSSTYNAVTNTVDDLMCGLFKSTPVVDDLMMNINDIRSAIVSTIGSSSLNVLRS